MENLDSLTGLTDFEDGTDGTLSNPLDNQSASERRYRRSTKYRQLKLLEPKIDERYRKGQISEEKYRRFKEFLREYK